MHVSVLFSLAVAIANPLAPLHGDWDSKEESIRPDGTKIPFTLTGTNRWALGGSTLVMDEELSLPGGRKAHNHIVMKWIAASDTVKAWWFTDGGTEPMAFSGKKTGDKMVLEGTNLKIEYDFERDGFYKARLLRKDGEEWKVATLAEYTRKTPK